MLIIHLIEYAKTLHIIQFDASISMQKRLLMCTLAPFNSYSASHDN